MIEISKWLERKKRNKEWKKKKEWKKESDSFGRVKHIKKKKKKKKQDYKISWVEFTEK